MTSSTPSATTGDIGGTLNKNQLCDLQGPLCTGFEYRHRRLGPTEHLKLKARDHLLAGMLSTLRSQQCTLWLLLCSELQRFLCQSQHFRMALPQGSK
ncbi:hypothetical protein PoB_002251000 [Plakobranchus ocellatus]|uniref:Uncharacterized protein n=1 Tax=Plakobranchus ocellatus TaxID=259542 RepID=A0AAV3ZK14_9GAST|nr:hypothetical protein PoB_002251000 [Plakobranchus ocellatus]